MGEILIDNDLFNCKFGCIISEVRIYKTFVNKDSYKAFLLSCLKTVFVLNSCLKTNHHGKSYFFHLG